MSRIGTKGAEGWWPIVQGVSHRISPYLLVLSKILPTASGRATAD